MSVTTFGTPSGVQQYEQLFTSSGTWTVPAGVKTCEVTVVGGSASYASGGASSAGGYFKGIVDVSSLSSVAVTVGAAGSGGAGGTSQFGTLIAAPGSIAGSQLAGAHYRPNLPGFSLNGFTGSSLFWSSSSGTTYTSDWMRTANGRFFTYLSNGLMYTLDSSSNFTQLTGNTPNFSQANRKVLYGGGKYLSIRVQEVEYTGSPYYSTDGISWNYSSFTAATVIDFTYGPAGWLVSTSGSNSMRKSADGVTWSTITSNLPNGYSYALQATSSTYYAFRNGSAVAYTSTDGVTWTSFNLNEATYSSTLYPKSFTSYGNKVYVLNGTSKLQEISGTTVTPYVMSFTAVEFINFNSIYMYSATSTYHSVLSPYAPVTASNFGLKSYFTGQLAGVSEVSGAAYLWTSGTNWYKGYGYAGQAGIESTSNPNSTSGVLGPTPGTPNLSYSYPVPGRGDDSGWGQGATASPEVYSRTYGSGVANSTVGNQGVVRVRWWA